VWRPGGGKHLGGGSRVNVGHPDLAKLLRLKLKRLYDCGTLLARLVLRKKGGGATKRVRPGPIRSPGHESRKLGLFWDAGASGGHGEWN
jgi:hypothetical protein